MVQLCTNAPLITNSALNGYHLHQCLLTHSECTQPTQMKCFSLHTQNALNQLKSSALLMHLTNSNQMLSLHTQNALNQLKRSASPYTNSECTKQTQIKCSPYALNQVKSRLTMLECGHMHIQCFKIPPKSTNPTFVRLQTRDGLQSSSKLLKGSKSASQKPSRTETCTMLECGHMHIQCFEIPPKSTNPALVHLQTRDGVQNLEAPLKLFKTPPRLQKHLHESSRSENLHLQQTHNLKISLNAHKQSNL